ncbi:hypothetical protein BKA70DRAFT_1223574 [Coprinopsis sp. MPI-PUGE-AT-0042]|nr:hypothetical protein BKA70DRAFT_1223574 [Coprinopsis sp. MPI-PUGE-AT-0042]
MKETMVKDLRRIGARKRRWARDDKQTVRVITKLTTVEEDERPTPMVSSNPTPQIAEAAATALNYVTSPNLERQHLTNPNVRTEEVDFSGSVANADCSIEDLILKDEHWALDDEVRDADPLVLKLAGSNIQTAVLSNFVGGAPPPSPKPRSQESRDQRMTAR